MSTLKATGDKLKSSINGEKKWMTFKKTSLEGWWWKYRKFSLVHQLSGNYFLNMVSYDFAIKGTTKGFMLYCAGLVRY